MMLRELQSWIKPKDFVYKTDVYSYYNSINMGWPQHLFETVTAYCKRIMFSYGPAIHSTRGIPKGGSLSPPLGALYLTPLDRAMERWMARGDCFYARFQDDIIITSRKRHVLRRMRKEIFKILDELQLILRPEKTFVGRGNKGFDLLGYHIMCQNMTPSQTTQKKAFEKGMRRYAQGGHEPLQNYLKRWRNWVHAGLPLKVSGVDEISQRLMDKILSSATHRNSQRISDCPPSLWNNRGHNIQTLKGNLKCKRNFFRH